MCGAIRATVPHGREAKRIDEGEIQLEDSAHLNADGQLVVETRFRVRYHETDAMGIVHHAAYITWFEEGRSAFTRFLGYPYSEMEAEGILLAISDVQARYHRSARYDEEIVVATTLQGVLSRGMSFAYEIHSGSDDRLLVSGVTHHVTLDRGGNIRRIPEQARDRLDASTRAVIDRMR